MSKVCCSMKLLPSARKISAISTVGRFIGPSFSGGWACRRGLESEEYRPDWSSIVDASETGADRSSSLRDQHAPEAFESFLGRCRVPTNGLPSCAAECGE